MPAIFKYDELRKFLRHLKDNYRVTSLDKWDGSNAIILRHDIDLNIRSAHRLALIEKEHQIESTFFVLITSPTYNALSSANRKLLAEISDLGFEIGLHFDPSVYENLKQTELRKKVDQEASILSSIVCKKVSSVSIHNPSVRDKYPIFKGYRNAYGKPFFSKRTYISDSRMTFSGDIYQFLQKSRKAPIQVLLHPMHFTEGGDTYEEIFCHFIREFVEELDATFSVNASYRASVKGNLFSRFVRNALKHECQTNAMSKEL